MQGHLLLMADPSMASKGTVIDWAPIGWAERMVSQYEAHRDVRLVSVSPMTVSMFRETRAALSRERHDGTVYADTPGVRAWVHEFLTSGGPCGVC